MPDPIPFQRINSAGFKQSERICPGCGEKKTFPNRQDGCSYACGLIIRAAKQKAQKAGCADEWRRFLGISEPAAEEKTSRCEQPQEKEQHEVKGDQWSISLDATRIRTLEQLVEHCEVDTRIWEVERFIANKWEVGAKNAAAEIIIEPLFQIKAWFRRKSAIAAAIDELADLKEAAKRSAPVFARIPRGRTVTGNLAEISIPDIHFGKLAWGAETGGDDYDVRIAVEGFNAALGSLLTRISSFTLERILFVLGNDAFNVDSRANTTTQGTPQDCDTRYHRLFKLVRRLMTDKIEELRQIAPVSVIVVPGNHDELSVWHLGDSLECWFHKCTDVTIDNAPTARKYYQHGSVMLMWTHGDNSKKERDSYPLQMATEQPKMFGDTRYREAHIGHWHVTRTEEFKGVRVRTLPSLCPPDWWHSKNAYTGSIRSAEVYVWNRDEGLISTATYSVPTQLKQAA